jgi:hypothetical protein
MYNEKALNSVRPGFLAFLLCTITHNLVWHPLQGHSIEVFNDLGDSIIEDIRRVIEQINNENKASLESNIGDTNGSASIVEEENEKIPTSEIRGD